MSPTDEELSEAWTAYGSDKDPAAMELLFATYARLAGYLARRALAKAPAHQDPEDILSYAHHGLLDAINKFNPQQGVKFETYATRRISGAIIDGQRAQDPLARNVRQRVKMLQRAKDSFWEREDREPTLDELAEAVGLDPGEVKTLQLAQKSMNSSLDVEHGYVETAGVQDDSEVNVLLETARARMASRLAELTPRERLFVTLFYCDSLPMKEVSEKLEISAYWCRQTRSNILNSLAY